MKTVFFPTLTADQRLQISEAAQTAEAIARGFMHGAIFIPTWAIFDSKQEVADLLVRLLFEVEGDLDSVG